MDSGQHTSAPGSGLEGLMSFGKMNVQISIAEEVISKDAEGFAVKSDNILAYVHSYREGRHGSQKWVNRAAFSDATDLFRFRTIPGLSVTTEHVIQCDGDRYEITSVEDVKGRGMYLEVLAKRIEGTRG